MNKVHPNNTSIKKTNLNNVNKASGEEVVENSRKGMKEKKLEKKKILTILEKR